MRRYVLDIDLRTERKCIRKIYIENYVYMYTSYIVNNSDFTLMYLHLLSDVRMFALLYNMI